jgi:hypothetical protein
MSLLHREQVHHDTVDPAYSTRTRERAWTFAPGQLVSLIIGIGVIAVGLVALVRAGIDGSLSEPVVEVLGYTHTAWLGIAEVGVGLFLVLAGLDARGRAASVLIGALAVIAGVLVLAEPGQMPEELGLEKAYGWPLIILGGIAAFAAMVFPVWFSQRVDQDVDIRDDRRLV